MSGFGVRRREALGYISGLGIACLGGCTTFQNGPDVRLRYKTRLESPVLSSIPSTEKIPPAVAGVIASRSEANNELQTGLLPKINRGEWLDLNYERYTVTALISRYDLGSKMSEGRLDVDWGYSDGNFRYDITIEQWPDELILDGERHYFTFLHKWETNTKPENGDVNIRIEY
jgi:hypothetical protein